jgi:hypothetical protein
MEQAIGRSLSPSGDNPSSVKLSDDIVSAFCLLPSPAYAVIVVRVVKIVITTNTKDNTVFIISKAVF